MFWSHLSLVLLLSQSAFTEFTYTAQNAVPAAAIFTGNAIARDDAYDLTYIGGGCAAGTLDGVTASNDDFCIMQYNSSGSRLWSKVLGSSGHYQEVTSLNVNAAGELFMLGVTYTGWPGILTTGTWDLATAKFFRNGTMAWAQVHPDTFTFNNGRRPANLMDDGTFAFMTNNPNAITKLRTSDGVVVSTTAITGNTGTTAQHFTVGETSNVFYVTGFTSTNTSTETVAGGRDIFLTKVHANGTVIWNRFYGNIDANQGTAVAFHTASQTVLICGVTQGTMYGNTATANDAFLMSVFPNGTLYWFRQVILATVTNEWCYGINIHEPTGHIYIGDRTSAALYRYSPNGQLLQTHTLTPAANVAVMAFSSNFCKADVLGYTMPMTTVIPRSTVSSIVSSVVRTLSVPKTAAVTTPVTTRITTTAAVTAFVTTRMTATTTVPTTTSVTTPVTTQITTTDSETTPVTTQITTTAAVTTPVTTQITTTAAVTTPVTTQITTTVAITTPVTTTDITATTVPTTTAAVTTPVTTSMSTTDGTGVVTGTVTTRITTSDLLTTSVLITTVAYLTTITTLMMITDVMTTAVLTAAADVMTTTTSTTTAGISTATIRIMTTDVNTPSSSITSGTASARSSVTVTEATNLSAAVETSQVADSIAFVILKQSVTVTERQSPASENAKTSGTVDEEKVSTVTSRSSPTNPASTDSVLEFIQRNVVAVSAVAASIFLLTIAGIIVFRRRQAYHTKKQKQTIQSMTFATSTTNLTKSRMSKSHIGTSHIDTSDMGTLINTTTALSLPGFWEMRPNEHYTVQQVIAQGGMGYVALAQLLEYESMKRNQNQTLAVVKMMHPHMMTQRTIIAFQQEIAIMYAMCRHRNIAKLVGYSMEPMALVMRYYQFGSLEDWIYQARPEWVLTVPLAVNFMVDVSGGLQSLHAAHYGHQDIKPQNILVDQDEHGLFAVLSDFGLARLLNGANFVSGFQISQLNGASIRYAAPEIFLRLRGSSSQTQSIRCDAQSYMASDSYAFGCMLYEVLNGLKPWN